MDKVELALNAVEHLLDGYFYYDRGDDANLDVDDMKELIKSKKLTADMIISRFDTAVRDTIKRQFGIES